MTFTDDDQKEYLRRHGDVPFYMSLLARLEAAEKLIPPEKCNGGLEEEYKAWRKMAGK